MQCQGHFVELPAVNCRRCGPWLATRRAAMMSAHEGSAEPTDTSDRQTYTLKNVRAQLILPPLLMRC